MKKLYTQRNCLLTLFLALLMAACVHPSLVPGELDDTFASKHGEDESKKMIGRGSCLSCHKQGGSGDGIFTLGGTVYKSDLSTPNPGGYVRFYTGPGGTGTLLKTIEVDDVANFYAQVPKLDFTTGVYPMVESSSGNKKYMSTTAASGDCLSCHGVSQSRIYVD